MDPKINRALISGSATVKFGQSLPRIEDRRFLSGKATYIDDLTLPNMAHGVLVYSPHAHARIESINKTNALRMPGVLAILTGEDLVARNILNLPPLFMPADAGGPPGYRTLRPILATDVVRHVGERVAFCIAETRTQALDAAEKIEVVYRPIESVSSVTRTVEKSAPQIWKDAPGNVCFTLQVGDEAKVEHAFTAAAHRTTLTLNNHRITANPMETRGAVGAHQGPQDTYTLYTSTQNPHRVRESIAKALQVTEPSVRVVGLDVGGGFGMKGDAYPEEILVLVGSEAVGRPVKWIPSRSDAFVLDSAARDQVVTGEMAFDENGKIVAMRARALHNLGAYIAGAALVPVIFSLKLIPNVYRIPVIDLRTQAVFTNTAPTIPYRGAGRPEAIYLTERLLDQAALELRIDPCEIRRRNFIETAAMPYKTPTGLVYDSGDFHAALEAARTLSDWTGYDARKAKSTSHGKLRGRALVAYIEDTGTFNDRMELQFDPSGTVTIFAGTFSHGQAHETTYSQCISDWLGIPLSNIHFVQGDTDKVAFGRGTYASGSAVIGGNALRLAADEIIEKGKAPAAYLLEVSSSDIEFRDGGYYVSGTDRRVDLQSVAKATYHPGRLPKELRTGLEANAYFTAEPPGFPNGCHVCEVVIDPETGAVEVERYTAADDFGRVINPLIVHGQVHGAIAQGIGQALQEEMRYDTQGQLLTGSFMDYAMPRATDVPSFALDFCGVPCRTNSLGVKGAGEGGSVASPPAIINAIIDALRPLGVDDICMPATPERVWQTIRAARKSAS